MKEKAVLIAVTALMLLAVPVFADNLGSQSMFKPQIKTFGILGKGIASLPSDPLNFKIVKAGVGTVRMTVLDQQTEITAGVLFLDDQRYTLKNIVIGNGSASADIYINDTQHGSLSLTSVIKQETEIWAGTLTLDGTTYNTYIMGGHRAIKATELKEKVSEYCSENRTDGNCRGKIEDFCESNPTDTRCLALFKAYCLRKNNMDDSRCREFMLSWCKDKNETEDCRAFAIERTGAYCAGHTGTPTCNAIQQKISNFTVHGENYCAEHADSVGCKYFCKRYPAKCTPTEPEEPEEPSEAELACTDSGGTVTNSSCCISATDFPDTCLIGACGCSAENSHEVSTCDCGEGNCFNGIECVAQEPEPEPEPSEAELACTGSGGIVTTTSCCTSASDFPDTCAIGACGCSAEESHDVSTCDCGSGNCFNGTACIAQEQGQNNETLGGQ